MDSSQHFGCCFEIIMWWFLLSFHVALRQPTRWLSSSPVSFWSIVVPISFIYTYSQFLQELLPTCSYHFGLGPDYLRVVSRRSVFRSTLVILFPQYSVYLDSVPRSSTWGGARWRITDNPTREVMSWKFRNVAVVKTRCISFIEFTNLFCFVELQFFTVF